MKDLNKMLSGLSKSGFLSGMAGGAVGGSLTNMVMGKKSKKAGKTALKVGALAAVGGLAWKAYQQYSTAKGAQSPQHSRFNYVPESIPAQRFEQIAEDNQSDNGQLLIMRAMITAAYADGHLDPQEQSRIFAHVEEMTLSVEEKASLFDELRNPLSLDALVTATPDSETAIEVYTASVLAIDTNQLASKQYLAQLADKLFIPTALREAIHQETM
ncbi:tellurite resistance TerB family protein [Alteromonas sediminis]|uniref:Tellurite resistance TerB family protein n=2 Tax=Alteromonas sediminis TaxID=2259342 RepID=A0A3N5XY70_9ALTE|nr:tellurite resistance TerB family protein [Alteromonas sediminis]